MAMQGRSDTGTSRLDEALGLLSAHESELRAKGVRHASIFGSVARGDAGPESDIDILVELEPAAHVSFFELMGIERRLSEIFGCKADIVSKGGLRPLLDDSILTDAILAF